MSAKMPILDSNQVSLLQKHGSFCCGNFHLEPVGFSNFPLQADAFERQINNRVFFSVIESGCLLCFPCLPVFHACRTMAGSPGKRGHIWGGPYSVDSCSRAEKVGGRSCCDKNKRITGLVAFAHCRWLHGAQCSGWHLRRSSSAADGKGRIQVSCVPCCSWRGQPCPQTVTRGEVDTRTARATRVCTTHRDTNLSSLTLANGQTALKCQSHCSSD